MGEEAQVIVICTRDLINLTVGYKTVYLDEELRSLTYHATVTLYKIIQLHGYQESCFLLVLDFISSLILDSWLVQW